jgi:hypothetical protein
MAVTIFAVIGCVAVWGQPYKVEFASSSSITINFDPSLTNMGEVQNVKRIATNLGRMPSPKPHRTACGRLETCRTFVRSANSHISKKDVLGLLFPAIITRTTARS